MGKLTKKLLLQYASHSDEEIQKAYRRRFCEELLKKGLVSIDDIPFGFAKGINPADFFILLTKTALTYDETSVIWENYFEIVSKTNVAPVFVAYGIIKLCNSRVNDSVKERGYQWLRELPETNWEDHLVNYLFQESSFNHKLAEIGLERVKKTPESLNMEDMLEFIPSYPVRLKLIKILAAKKQQKVCVVLLNYCLEDLILKSFKSKNDECAKYLPQALKLLPLIINGMTSSEGLTETNCRWFSIFYTADNIDIDTYLKISDKLAKLADKENNNDINSLLEGLKKAAKQSPEALLRVENITKKALAVSKKKTLIFDVLCNLYLHWIKIDEDIFLKIAAQVPEDLVYELMRIIAVEHPQLWDKFFAKLKDQERMIPTIICSLIKIYEDENCAAVREKAGCKIEDLLNKFKFDKITCKIISQNLQTIEGLKNLQVRSTKLSVQEVADILSLLNE